MGSLMTWTSLACPFFSSSATFGKRRRDRPPPPPPALPPPLPFSSSGSCGSSSSSDSIRSEAWRNALFSVPDVDERGLNPRQHRVHRAEVDVAHHAAGVGTIHQEFNKAVVLQDGHAGLPRAPADEYFPFQSMCPRSRSASSRSGSYSCPNRNACRVD